MINTPPGMVVKSMRVNGRATAVKGERERGRDGEREGEREKE